MMGLLTRLFREATAHNVLNQRTVEIFFQRFPGTSSAAGIKDLDFRVLASDGSLAQQGKTTSNGRIRIRLGAGETAKLEVLGSVYDVSLLGAALHPIDELRGVQQRLNMLGYNAGALQTPVAPAAAIKADTSFNQSQSTELAIVDFQSDNNPLFIDAIAGPKTQARLKQVVKNAGGE